MKPIFILRNPQGFTLVEMLAIMAIIAIVVGFVVPSIGSIMRGNEMTRGEQLFLEQMALARQTAVAKNRRVEVRLYSFDDPDVVGTDNLYRAFQTFIFAEDNTAKPLGKIIKLPGTLAINSSSTVSTLMTLTDKTFEPAKDPKIIISGVGASYTAKAFQFRPDGSTNLPPPNPPLQAVSNWFLTLVSSNVPSEVNSETPPPNFATVQIDPIGGTVRSYRP